LSREITSWGGTTCTITLRSTFTKLLHDRNEDDEARPLHRGEAAECEDDTALVFPQDANGLGEEYDDKQRNRRIGQVIEHHDVSPSLTAADARRTTSVKSTMLDTSDDLAGPEGFNAAGAPAFTMRKDVSFVLVPVEDLRRQTAHGLRANPCRTAASAPNRTEHDKNKAGEHRRDDGNDRPRQPVAGRLDPEKHDRSQDEGDDPPRPITTVRG